MANDLEVVPESLGQSIIQGGQSLTRVGAAFTGAIAVQKPRKISAVQTACLEEAALMDVSGFYSWGEGKDRIEGATVKLAMALVRCWGNCCIEVLPVQETSDAWIFTACFVDLETGFTLSRQFRQSKKWTVYGKFDSERKDDIRFQIGQSKATRNVVLNALPEWLVDRCLDACKGGVKRALRERIAKTGIEPVIDSAIARAKELGIDEARVLAAFDFRTRHAFTLEELTTLSGMLNAVAKKIDLPEAIFPPVAAPTGDQAADSLKGKLSDVKGSAKPIGETAGDFFAQKDRGGAPEQQSEADKFEDRRARGDA